MPVPRCPREKAKSGTYHVLTGGINRQDIFHCEQDYWRFLDIIKRVQTQQQFRLYAYCLMRNHVHLLLQEQDESIAATMKRIGVSYAGWYNAQYDRTGPVFQDRFKSEPVEDTSYLMTVLRYIHHNPVEAQFVVKPQDYSWSSCKEYDRKSSASNGLINTAHVLAMFSEEQETARTLLREFTSCQGFERVLDIDRQERKSDDELRAYMEHLLAGQSVLRLRTMKKGERNSFLQQVKKVKGVTQRQIARVTGLNANIIFKA